jgi:glycosyltransferase involved in cell wall biosynthesis
MRTVIVIPAYNEARMIGEVVRSARAVAEAVVVVDDGSADRTGEIAANAGAIVVTHVMNRGYGAGTATGIAAALRLGAEAIVTFDADGQHRASDVPRIVAPLERGEADVVMGVRTMETGRIPVTRRLAHWCANALTYALFGRWVTDSHSGLRAFSRRMAEGMDLKCDRMEVASEIIKEIHRGGWRLAEVPIVPIYTDYSLSKGQSFTVGIKTAWRLILSKLLH